LIKNVPNVPHFFRGALNPRFRAENGLFSDFGAPNMPHFAPGNVPHWGRANSKARNGVVSDLLQTESTRRMNIRGVVERAARHRQLIVCVSILATRNYMSNRSVRFRPLVGRRVVATGETRGNRSMSSPAPKRAEEVSRDGFASFAGASEIRLCFPRVSPVATILRPFRADENTEQLLSCNHTLYEHTDGFKVWI